MTTITATIYFEARYWVATFERTDKEGYVLARHIFGSEPSDPEIYEFVLNNFLELKFGMPKMSIFKFRERTQKEFSGKFVVK